MEDPISGGAKDNAAMVRRSGWCVVVAAGWGSRRGEKENERRERTGERMRGRWIRTREIKCS
jgi:hypothetical protein